MGCLGISIVSKVMPCEHRHRLEAYALLCYINSPECGAKFQDYLPGGSGTNGNHAMGMPNSLREQDN
jgi:hypothetical protein